MALIEGVGDEVTLLFGSLLLLAVMLLAWISTRTAEPPEHLFTTGPAPSPGHAHTDTPAPPAEAEAPPTEATAASNEADAAAGADGADGADGGDGGERNMVLRIKFLNDTETTAQVKPQDTIGYIKRTYFSGREQQVRLIYQGQLLQDDGQTLASLNLAHNCVLHCHISAAAAAGAGRARGGRAAADPVQVALNVGSLMVPVLVLMLSVLWYCQIQYRQFFRGARHRLAGRVTIFLSLVALGLPPASRRSDWLLP
ncbi:hypothetical protein EPR50_G00133060 [Perca flavescens]|uniref:Transmembrane and ubiquitin-like domain-containing protein 1 n=1 Tax=Perca flavescens TaxID=8167 RepID=A0A484CSG6_PERFV|nr:transmembrane and ubiquitin-like domain-containing protein 1 [Perca flavescens]TDH06396.1 hypothetical protein EPR50_G00133060 [Perca flavescens]